MKAFSYRGAKTREISFPLGGIGSGCIGLGGTGHLVDWEIFNRPAKGSRNGFSHFAVKAESKGKLLDARVCAARRLRSAIRRQGVDGVRRLWFRRGARDAERVAAFSGDDIPRSLPLCGNRLPGSRLSWQGEADRLQSDDPAQRRRLQPAGGVLHDRRP